MDKQEASILLEKYNSGKATKAEELLLQYWFIHEATRKEENLYEHDYIDIQMDMWRVVEQRTRHQYKILWPRIAVAAAMLIVIGFSTYFYINKSTHVHTIAYANDVAPGKHAATLTLANGKKIALTDAMNGELADEAGVSISKTSDGQIVYNITKPSLSSQHEEDPDMHYNTLSTANGETYQVRLPDGSLVALNAASSLTYPIAINEHDERRVELKGEAYFEIAKDKNHPFIVKSDGQEVKVIGTHFNINAYTDEGAIKTTLLEGSIQVNVFSEKGTKNSDRAILKPGQQSILEDNRLKVGIADVDHAIAWKNGMFEFKDADIKTILRQMSRWYNIEVVYKEDIPADVFTGGISRYSSLSSVLRILQVSNIKYKIENGAERKKLIINP